MGFATKSQDKNAEKYQGKLVKMFQDKSAVKYLAKLVNKSLRKSASRSNDKSVNKSHVKNVHQSMNVKFANSPSMADKTNVELISNPFFKSIQLMIFIFCLELNIK